MGLAGVERVGVRSGSGRVVVEIFSEGREGRGRVGRTRLRADRGAEQVVAPPHHLSLAPVCALRVHFT